MNISDFEAIEPYVRMVKIKKSLNLKGAWVDLDHVLIYIANGFVVYNVAGTSYPLHYGDLILIPPYLLHTIERNSDDQLIQYILHFDFYTDAARACISHQSASKMNPRPELPAAEQILQGNVMTVSISAEERFQYENLYLQMYREFSRQRLGYASVLRGMAIQLIFSILRNMRGSELISHSPGRELSSKPQKLVKSALEYIWLHFDQNIKNTTIADAINVSPNYLARIFHQYTGMSLHKYITSYRLEQAQQMLISGRYNITEVARNCGFSSIHIFSKLFKQECSVSPSAYAAMPPQDIKILTDTPDYDLQRQTYYSQ